MWLSRPLGLFPRVLRKDTSSLLPPLSVSSKDGNLTKKKNFRAKRLERLIKQYEGTSASANDAGTGSPAAVPAPTPAPKKRGRGAAAKAEQADADEEAKPKRARRTAKKVVKKEVKEEEDLDQEDEAQDEAQEEEEAAEGSFDAPTPCDHEPARRFARTVPTATAAAGNPAPLTGNELVEGPPVSPKSSLGHSPTTAATSSTAPLPERPTLPRLETVLNSDSGSSLTNSFTQLKLPPIIQRAPLA